MKSHWMGASALVLASLLSTQAFAQAAAAPASGGGEEVDAVVVTGTRTTGLRAVDSAAPVQVLGQDILKRTGAVDLITSLAANVPSLQAQVGGADLEAITLSYKLRGLSPNDTLVLVNGARRHPTANVAVGGGPFGGGQAPDVAFIPPSAIDHVEVLTDGAAAQYGTDAIAGVVNIILKKNTHGGQISVTGGQYFDGGGLQTDFSANAGFAPTDKSYLNVTFENTYHGMSFRGDVDPRIAPGKSILTTYPAITSGPGYPYVNMIGGDGQSLGSNFIFNAGYEVTPNVQLYAFGSIGYHNGRHYENYRTPAQSVSSTGVPLYPAGFNPMENNRDTDYALTVGAKGTFGSDTTWNIASDYGRDYDRIYVLGSMNRALYYDTGSAQTTFHDGDFSATQWANTVDLTHTLNFKFLPEPVVLAAGGEYRIDSYQIKAGDASSYYSFDTTGKIPPSGQPGGASSFYGYGPSNSGYHQRDNWAGYFDAAATLIKGLKVDVAVRYENYSDFGSATVEKATARYDFNDAIAIRGTASTGFRAPSLGEGYYSGVNVGPTTISGLFAPNSAGAKFLGLNGLQPETSTNYSVGLVTHFLPRLTMTLDAYSINIENRILLSGAFYGFNAAGGVVSPSVLVALAASGVPIPPSLLTATSGSVSVQAFVNGASTLTRGIDYLATYPVDYGAWGHVDYSLSANYTSTSINSINKPPSNVSQSVALLDPSSKADITSATPKYRVVASAYWTWGDVSVNFRENFYGASYRVLQNDVTSLYEAIPVQAAATTDLEIGYSLPHNIKVYAGATNLLNTYPTKEPADYRAAQYATNDNTYASSLYPSSSPFGYNGGYYYGRITWNF